MYPKKCIHFRNLLMTGLFFCILPSLDAQDLSEKANAFLNSLSSELRASAKFPFDNAERFNWHFIPRGRKGPTFHNFNETQKNFAVALMQASLSEEGYRKANEIFGLENVLRVLENRPEDDDYRDPLNYHFSVFGNPGPTEEWGWRLEGHHLSLNFSSTKGELISATPSFYGSNPGVVPSGMHKGKTILENEMNMGFTLINSMDQKQMQKAKVSGKAPDEIITGNNRNAELIEPIGISFKELNQSQQKMFLDLLAVYVGNYSPEYSQLLMDKVKEAGMDNLSFAWAGSLQPGSGHYYRIQGPSILIEYDNTQNDANHIHTVVRDLTGDFGEDTLGEHYRLSHTFDHEL